LNPCQVRQHTDLRIARGGERRQAEIASRPHARIVPFAPAGPSRGTHGSGVPLRRRRGVRGLGPSEKYSQDGWKEDQVPWLSWQPALILPLLFYCAAPPSPSRSLVIAAPPSSLASSYPPLAHAASSPSLSVLHPSPPSHSLMHSETRTQTGAQPVTHAPGIYARMPIIPLARPRDSLTLSRFSLHLFLCRLDSGEFSSYS